MKTIVLDDGIEYVIVKEQEINNIIYTLFANIDDSTDICLRKTVIKDGEEYYSPLDSENELSLVLATISKNVLKEIE